MEAIGRERAARSRILAAAERIGKGVPDALRSTKGTPDVRRAQYVEGVAELLERISPAPDPEAEVEEPENDGKKRKRKGVARLLWIRTPFKLPSFTSDSATKHLAL